MPSIQIETSEQLFEVYRRKGYPLGKSVRGRKKWLKQWIARALIEWANNLNNETT